MSLIHTEKFKLAVPLKLASGKELTEVNLRRPKVRDLKQVQRAHSEAVDQQVALLALASEEQLVPEDIDDMDLGDYMQINTFFQRIMGIEDRSAGNGRAAGPLVPVSAK